MALYEILLEAKSRVIKGETAVDLRIESVKTFFHSSRLCTSLSRSARIILAGFLEFQVLDRLYRDLALESLVVHVVA
jgi:hypothetical protein